MPGNEGGPGRPSSLVRARLRGSFDDRLSVLEAVADGDPVQKMSVPLASVLPHARCPKCGGKLKLRKGLDLVDAWTIKIQATASATPGERVRSLDVMAKYGLGANQEFTEDAIKARIADMLQRIRAEFAPEVAEHMIATIKPSWR